MKRSVKNIKYYFKNILLLILKFMYKLFSRKYNQTFYEIVVPISQMKIEEFTA
jgi:hypothetical protein